MRFEDKLLKLLNKGLRAKAKFNFKDFKIEIEGEDYFLVESRGKFYFMDSINYAEEQMMEDD